MQEENQTTNSSQSKKGSKKITIIIVVVIILIAGAIIFALRGSTSLTGAYPASIKTGSTVCTKSNISYPYVTNAESHLGENGDLRIVGTYDQSKQIEKIALNYTAIFPDNATAVTGEAHMHAVFGRKLTEDGLVYSEFNNNFSIVDKKVVLSLYAPMEKINDANYHYLLLSSNPEKGLLLAEFEKTYESEGFTCVSTN